MSTTSRVARPRGRQSVVTDPEHRRACVAVAHARIEDGMTIARVAELAGVSERSVRYWTGLALTYPEGAYLRRLRSA